MSESVSIYAQCLRPKGSSPPLGSEPQFETGHSRRHHLVKEDLGPMRARKMGKTIRRAEELQRNGDNPERTSRSAATWDHIFRASRSVFSGRVPENLFPNEMPGREARQRALEAMREALCETINTIKYERIEKWKSRMRESTKGTGKWASKWLRGDTAKLCG